MSANPPEAAQEPTAHALLKISPGDPLALQMFVTLCEQLCKPGGRNPARMVRAFAVSVVANDQLDEAVQRYRLSVVARPKVCGCIYCLWLPEVSASEVFGSLEQAVLYGFGTAIADDVQKRGAALAGAQFAKFEVATKRTYCVDDFRAAECCEAVLEQLRKVMPEVLAVPLGQQRKVETVAEHNAPADSNLGEVTGSQMRAAGHAVDSLLKVGEVDRAKELLETLSTRAGRQLCVTDFHQFVDESVHLESLAKLLPMSPEHMHVLVHLGAHGVPVVVMPERTDNGVVSEHVEDEHTAKIVSEQQGDGP